MFWIKLWSQASDVNSSSGWNTWYFYWDHRVLALFEFQKFMRSLYYFLADRTLVKVELLAWVVVRPSVTDVLWLNGAR